MESMFHFRTSQMCVKICTCIGDVSIAEVIVDDTVLTSLTVDFHSMIVLTVLTSLAIIIKHCQCQL